MILLLAGAFALRLAYGLASDFWGGDPLQIFLIGLRAYTLREWPYFGPDVVYTETQIPGALQGLVVAGPLSVVPLPEAPIVFLNLLSFSALVLFAVYVRRRVPSVPAWFTWPWLLFSPWTLNLSTHVLNPSYVLPASILFWISFLETLPGFRIGFFSQRLTFFLLGFTVFWIAQLHLSFAVLIPVVLVSFAVTAWRRQMSTAILLLFVAGAALGAATLVPTLLRFGLAGAFSAGVNAQATPSNLLRAPQFVARFFSFASFELPRFIGPDTPERIAFLQRHLWAAPFVLFAAACGVVQPLVLVANLFRRRGSTDWNVIRWATIGVLALVYASFAFSIKNPASQAFYVVLPLVMIYSFYCWAPLFTYRFVRVIGVCLLVAGAVAHVAIGVDNFRGISLYTNRSLVVRAIQERNYRLLGERRSVEWGLQRD